MKFKALFGLTLGAATVTLASAAPGGGYNCPEGTVGDRPFVYARDAQHCHVLHKWGNHPGARQGRYYRVMCPGRMTKQQALQVGQAFTSGSISKPTALVSIPKDYDAYQLVKRKAATLTGFSHTNCFAKGGWGQVSTLFDFEVASDPSSASHAAKHCRDVNQSGSLRIGGHMDREYRCTIHFKNTERGFAQDTAKALLKTPALLQDARSKKIRMCLKASTDIQCAPCSTSNKLVMRVYSVLAGGQCPAGTIAYAE